MAIPNEDALITLSAEDALIKEMSKLATPADIFFHDLQKSHCYTLFPGKFIRGDDIHEDDKKYYFNFNRGIFSNLNAEKLRFFRKLFHKLFSKYGSITFKAEVLKDDKVEVFVFDTFVVRFYDCSILDKQKAIFKIQNEHTNLERIYEAKECEDDNFGYIVSEKLIPLVYMENSDLKLNRTIVNPDNLTKLKNDIKNALSFLHGKNIRHKDVRLDNIGFRPKDSKFVLFDFEGSGFESDVRLLEYDKTDFDKSLKYHELE